MNLQLLHRLETDGVLQHSQLETMVKYWQYEKDKPKQWRAQCRKLFGEPLPILQVDGD